MRILLDRTLSREVWKLAWPVVVGMVSQTLLNVVDTAMVGRLGAASLGAAGLGGVLAWMILGGFGALNVGTQAVAARRYGEGDPTRAGMVHDNALVLAVLLGLFITLLVAPGMREVFHFFSTDPVVVAQGKAYVYYRLLGGLPMMIVMAERGFFNGVGLTKLHMRVAILINASNVLFNYILIFGNFGAPRMETAGAGLASALATALGASVFLTMALIPRRRKRFRLFRPRNVSRNVSWSIIRLTTPSGLQAVLVMLGFSVFTAIVARIGTIELAATNVCITVISFSFLPGAGMGIAAASLIGQKLGEKKPEEAQECGWEAARLGIMLMGAIGLLFIAFPSEIFRIFTNDPAVIEAGTIPLRMMGFVQVFDAVGMVFSQALQGAGLNKWVLVAEVSVSWGFFLPGTVVFAFVFGWGLIGAWIALGLYLIILGVVVTLKFAGGSWKRVKV